MKTRMVALAAVAFVAIGMFMAAPLAARRPEPIERFTATSAMLTSPARLTLRPVDIVISQWSTYMNHRELETALMQKGPVAFLNLLAGFGRVGTFGVMGAPDIAIRYAWSVGDRDGARRVYLATDEPVSLAGPFFRRFPDGEPLTFIELRITRDGTGEGKLSEALRLTVDQSRDVIELSDYAARPLHLISVRSTSTFDE
jgi:hypothetical protein